MAIQKSCWFGRKKFGFGFGPRSWQGWTVTAAYVVLMLSLRRIVPMAYIHVAMLGLTAAFFAVFLLKLDTSGRS